MALCEHLLLTGGDGLECGGRAPPGAPSPGQVARPSHAQLGLGTAFTIMMGACASPFILAGGAASVRLSDEAAKQSVATRETLRLGGMAKVFQPFQQYAPAIELFGALLYAIPFLVFGYRHAKDFSAFVHWLDSLGLPKSKLMAAGGMASLIVGSLLLLSGIPILMASGAKIISVFLVFATYFGHVVPLRSAAKDSRPYVHNVFMLWKNTSLFGGAWLIGWCSAPKAFDDLATTSSMMNYMGLLIICIGFLVPAWMEIRRFNDFVGRLGRLGLPISAKAGAISGITIPIVACIFITTACPMLMEIGAEVLAVFLLLASYYGHYKPMKAAAEGSEAKQEEFAHLLKNVGILGGLIVIIGRAMPLI